MSLLIADIGSSHLGKLKAAKELIRVAHESGADLIKGQAYRARDVKCDDMPLEFYELCQFTEEQYLELLAYARSIKTDMFFSVLSPGFDRLKSAQRWSRFTTSQTREGKYRTEHDTSWTTVSVPRTMIRNKRAPFMRNAWALYATDHLVKDPQLESLNDLSDQVRGVVGLADHTAGTETCLKAIKWHGAFCIEKHFTLQKEVMWGGKTLTDSVHGASPRELEIIAYALGDYTKKRESRHG